MAQREDEIRQAMNSFMEKYMAAMPPNNIDISFMRALTVHSLSLETETSPPKATFAFTIPEDYGNNPQIKSVHGAAIAMFFDETTSLAMLAVKRGWGHTGVSRNLKVTYMRPAQMGERCLIDVEILQVGKAVATIRAVLKRESDGVVLAICQHEKAKPSDDRGKYFKL